ncbi:cbb3-type cytochrome c oxidase N-terminal domain-containing protein [Persicobacter diffluens]|uniref:Cytochrome c oxidase subunit III n=1 Tax=Persicobacter diffluens TaxID=981 RepID=A0AAN5AK21_9BACT|nr:cytochrome c oxidase subunit III [Persicobacter diffluens]
MNTKAFKYKAVAAMALLMGMMPELAFAQSGGGLDEATALKIMLGLTTAISLGVLLVAIFTLKVVNTVMQQEAEKKAEAEGKELVRQSWWWGIANEAVPIEQEEEILLDHNYDGIQELDNHLPPWWKALFAATVVFGVIYVGVYHVFNLAPLSGKAYDIEMAEAALKAADIDESNVTLLTDDAGLTRGEEIFVGKCVVCHGKQGEGKIGPNLTDEYWIHGGGIKDVFKVVKDGGRPGKGMISWKKQLSAKDMQAVSSYILTLQGTNPPNAKEAEGEKYVAN